MDTIQVLLSTTNLTNLDILDRINYSRDEEKGLVVVNQIYKEGVEPIESFENVGLVFRSIKDKGLAKSRNLSISLSKKDICLLCDDDVVYNSQMPLIVTEAYRELPEADIIIFKGESLSESRGFSNFGVRVKKLNKRDTLKVSSVLVSFKRTSVKGIYFDERFGSGSGIFTCGEENIFLFDCLDKGLSIYYYPKSILEKSFSNSLWYNGFDELYFETKGAVFYRLFGYRSYLISIFFLIIKRKLFKGNGSLVGRYRLMLKGIRKLKTLR
ncbi:hypothetical protein [Myroides injenensis]|uniref:hypothetical protein n=1 Tax=Myroides injenensis TaxID=1183151 RepID=UPI00028A05D3|nr:hypothetical protein [Myroides injenensis]